MQRVRRGGVAEGRRPEVKILRVPVEQEDGCHAAGEEGADRRRELPETVLDRLPRPEELARLLDEFGRHAPATPPWICGNASGRCSPGRPGTPRGARRALRETRTGFRISGTSARSLPPRARSRGAPSSPRGPTVPGSRFRSRPGPTACRRPPRPSRPPQTAPRWTPPPASAPAAPPVRYSGAALPRGKAAPGAGGVPKLEAPPERE